MYREERLSLEETRELIEQAGGRINSSRALKVSIATLDRYIAEGMPQVKRRELLRKLAAGRVPSRPAYTARNRKDP